MCDGIYNKYSIEVIKFNIHSNLVTVFGRC